MNAMEYNIDDVLLAMIEYDEDEPKRIQHLLKVHAFARLIGRKEGLDSRTQLIVEVAAAVHDIGSRNALLKYGESSGKYQEMEGPDEARKLLQNLGWPEDIIERVAFLVGHHHTYLGVDGLDYQILIESDFLVNMYDIGYCFMARDLTYQHVFKTETGKRICRTQYPDLILM